MRCMIIGKARTKTEAGTPPTPFPDRETEIEIRTVTGMEDVRDGFAPDPDIRTIEIQ